MNERIKELETKLMHLGFSGLAYTKIWNDTAQELNQLKDIRKKAEGKKNVD